MSDNTEENQAVNLQFAEGTEGMSTGVEYARPKRRTMPMFDMKDDIVISGIAGRFPECDNMDELADNLYKNVDMVTNDDRRWPTDLNQGLGSRTGKLKEIDKFDAVFFSTFALLADSMDPIARISLETTYECICDAGINPQDLRGSRTGVYFGINTVACADGLPNDDFNDFRSKEAAIWVYGAAKALYANRISYLFDFQGPSILMDTACSGSMVAFQQALAEIRTGNCDMAIVGTGNLVQSPFSNSAYSSIGLLAQDGKCKVWDKKADGFVRSETVGCLLLQRRSQAKRVYATVLHAKTNTDGFKSIGLFSPFWLRQRDLMIETYEEAGIDPHEIKYFESHGTGTNVGDPQESKAIADAYCVNRKDPLLVGAVKSNLGHSEGSSGLCSVGKVILTFENKCIPANLHFEEPKQEIDVIVNKTLIPVTENTPFDGGIVGINSFGVGGVNSTTLLKSHNKEPSVDNNEIVGSIPRIINVCGRTKDAVNHIFNFIENNPEKVTRDFLALLSVPMKTHSLKGSPGFLFRGHMVIKKEVKEGNSLLTYKKSIESSGNTSPIWLVFSGMGSQWTGMAKTLMNIEVFAKSLNELSDALTPLEFDLMHLLLSDDKEELKKNVTNAFVAITAMQIALFDVLSTLNIDYEGIIGHSFGEVACAYADGCLTRKQAILTAYYRGKIVENAKLPIGMLAAVGLSWEETIRRCPVGIVAACHNGSDSVTISGLYDSMVQFIEQLRAENIFVREVAGGNFPYHSPFMNMVAPKLLEALNKIIPEPKPRSDKWISTSVPEDDWLQNKAKYASGEYFTNNLISPVLFNEGMRHVNKNATIIEVAPHSLFESIFKRCFSSLTYVGLMKRNESDNLDFLLNSFGKLYTLGINLDTENLYPKVEFPVARGTQSISSLIKWDHEKSYEVKKFPEHHNFSTASDYIIKISLLDADWAFLKDHAVDGRVLFPATGYLMIVWRRFATLNGQPWNKVAVAFENVRFFRPTLLSEGNEVKFTIRILNGTGDFTVSEGSSIAATGRVYTPDEPMFELQEQIDPNYDDDDDEDEDSIKLDETLNNKDIYKELRIRGYDYGPRFQGLVEARGDGKRGKAKWTENWVSFVDSVMHLALIALPIRALFIPIGFQSIRCDPIVLFDAIEKSKKEDVKEETQETDKKEFFYFNESTKEKYTEDENDSEAVFDPENLVDDFKPGLTPEESKESKRFLTDSIKTTITYGEESFASELLGIPKMNLDKNRANDGKSSVLPVAFNLNYRSIVTNGLEIKGFLPVNVPRRPAHKGLTLEKYQFVAHNEECALETKDKFALIEYIQVCCALAKQLTAISKNLSQIELNGFKAAEESTVKKYLNQSDDRHVLMKVLNEILNLKVDDNQNIIIKESGSDTDFEVLLKKVLDNPENDVSLDLINSLSNNEKYIRPSLDLILENVSTKNFKILELNPSKNIFANDVIDTIKNSSIGIMNIDVTVATPFASSLSDAAKLGLKTVEWDLQNNQILKEISSNDLTIFRSNNQITDLWSINDQITALADAIKEKGFLILAYRSSITPPELPVFELLNRNPKLETLSPDKVTNFIQYAENNGFKLIGKRSDSVVSSHLLFRKIQKTQTKEVDIIRITSDKYEDWLETVKAKIAENRDSNGSKNIWLVSNDSSHNGILGLALCLRSEPGGQNIRCLYDYDNLLPHDINFNSKPYNDLQTLDLAMNVYRNGKWGTFRHISLQRDNETIESQHAYLNVMTRGDMSSMRWFDAHHKHFTNSAQKKEVLCYVYNSALNFKDVMLVSGRIQPGPESALFDCIIGLEFAGRRSDTGERVMGMVPFKGIATSLVTYKEYLWNVPDEWSLEDAATVPVVYVTAYYALISRGRLKEGESVLIHSGAGGVGQAAIFICKSLNCKIFVSVGNEEKREFIKKKFNIEDKYICNSHDTSFEKKIMKVTKGKGVDVILNSLTEDKLQASVRCLAPNGRFLEIGKYDMQMNKNLGLFAFLQNITFHGVGIDCVFREGTKSPQLKSFMDEMKQLLEDGISRGVVKPIERTTFKTTETEEAFRYMTTGQHIGKVIIKVRDEETNKVVTKPLPLTVNAFTKTWFHPSKVYIITGGLGGFGLELAYWLVLRGAKKIVLTSRTGVKNGYQQLYLKRFEKFGQFLDDYRIDLYVSTHNATTIKGANDLVEECESYGPIGGIFNLAMVLNDALIENQTTDTFTQVCQPKLEGLKNLDVVSREKCPQLDYFVAFSSFTSGRGNGGQSNYGYANSAMERICEDRRTKGLHGLAIQWGPIGDVGIVAEQLFSTDDKADAMKLFGGIVLQRISSCLEVLDRFLQLPYPVLSSYVKADTQDDGNKSEDEVMSQLCNYLGLDTRPNDATLGDVGLDSMMAVEIQQRLERDYELNLALADIKKITVAEMKEFRGGNKDGLKQYSDDVKKVRANLSQVRFDVPTEMTTPLNKIKTGKPIYLLPPINGIFDTLQALAKEIKRPVIALNWTKSMQELKNIKKVAQHYKDKLKQLMPNGEYEIIGHSFGAIVGIEMCRKLVPIKTLIVLDPSTIGIKDEWSADERFEILFDNLTHYIPERILMRIKKEVMDIKGEQNRINKLVELIKHYGGKDLQGKDVDDIIRHSFDRADMIIKYRKKNIAKMQSVKQSSIIMKRLRKIKTDVTIVKLLRKQEEIQEIQEKILNDCAINRDEIEGRFDVYTVIGAENEFLTTHLQQITDIVNKKV